VFSFAHWRYSKIAYGVPRAGCFSCAFGSYFHVRSSYKKIKKNLKKLKTYFFKNLGFSSPAIDAFALHLINRMTQKLQ